MYCRILLFFLVVTSFISARALAEVTAEQRRRLRQVAVETRSLQSLLDDGQLVACAQQLTAIQHKLLLLLESSEPALQQIARTHYDRLSKVHGLLELEGVEIEALPSWESITEGAGQSTSSTDEVSFARTIAPLLVEHCDGCHINARRASGNLRMDTFEQILRGGASGALIAGTNATDSLLVRRLKGQGGDRMPAGGRPPLSDEEIRQIATWIREGAKFDGHRRDAGLESIASRAWADGAGHRELFERRQEAARQKWLRVLPNEDPSVAQNDDFFVIGNASQANLDTVLEQLVAAASIARGRLGVAEQDAFVRGGVIAFVLRNRYEYGEFGRMTEERELPPDWLGHWQADPLDVYAVLVAPTELDGKQTSPLALQLIVGGYLGSFADVPHWFAEGVARNLVVEEFRRSDPRTTSWSKRLPSAWGLVKDADSLMENRLDEESAGLVGMAVTYPLLQRSNRRRFDKLLELLREGRSFNEAMTFAFAPPEALIKARLSR